MKLPRLTLKRPRLTPRRNPSRPSQPVPWWVRWFTDAGRPIVAVVVLIMCAPGEHHLAVLAGWDARLAWGMAAVLAAYAGIAASVASKRPKGAPGRGSAILGAFVSLSAAMAAQPVSHMFVTGHLSSSPRTPLWLVIVVSCVPPLVFGHLLHLAATPVGTPTEASETPAPQPAEPVAAPSRTSPAAPWELPAGAQLLPIVAAPTETPETPPATVETEPRLIATREVAERLSVADSTVRSWVERGRIRPVVRDGRGMLFDERDVAAMAVGS
ncbi:excisionase family DNA-binding protein [Streptomyces sp. NBC_00249]|uniref:excisionase family DNA-binding protein n=1 Tax=Streptomyces sp. NBC_00249 TaxID=2975690 RepID=UPI002252032A|nr:excisionase family DNA-binding protein [Streptomyces sp. NBC_00249]MCX5197208.1 excisionase family DNA-binding protein [Streptomyces sp. NBC_00249]